MSQLIECVPNFSEGRDLAIIKQITDALNYHNQVASEQIDMNIVTEYLPTKKEKPYQQLFCDFTRNDKENDGDVTNYTWDK